MISKKGDQYFYIIISAEIYPIVPGLSIEEIDALYNSAMTAEAEPYYACINLASTNSQHFNDNVLLYNDKTMYKVVAFSRLEAE